MQQKLYFEKRFKFYRKKKKNSKMNLKKTHNFYPFSHIMKIASNWIFIVLIADQGTHPTVVYILTVVYAKHCWSCHWCQTFFKQYSTTLCVCRWNNHIKDAKMTIESTECKNNPDDFCYVCGEYNSTVVKKPITTAHERAYLSYFGFGICDQNKSWVPHFLCKNCHLGLLKWMNDCGGGLSFAKPMCWRKPNDHNIDCYFCLTRIDCDTGRVEYANVISITQPIANNMPVNPQPPNYIAPPPVREKNIKPHLILPNELDLLISGLNLSERSAEILVKTFQEWKILAPCKHSNWLNKFSRVCLFYSVFVYSVPGFHRRKVAEVM